MKKFEYPEYVFIKLDANEDIIRTSGEQGETDPDDPFG